MREIKLMEYVENRIEKIKEAMRKMNTNEIYPTQIDHLQNGLIDEMISAARAIGLQFEASVEDILKVKLTVPKDSELFYIDESGDRIDLSGENAAKTAKMIFVKILATCTSMPESHASDNVKFLYKVRDSYISYDDFSKVMSDISNGKNKASDAEILLMRLKNSSKAYKEAFMMYIEEMDMLERFGIKLSTGDTNKIMEFLKNPNDNTNTLFEITFIVPESSIYLHCGKELCGETAFEFAMETMHALFGQFSSSEHISFTYEIVDGLHWNKDGYEMAATKSKRANDLLKKIIY